MSACNQTDTQSVLQHGISVRDHMKQLIHILQTNETPDDWRIPSWMTQYRENILNSLLPWNIIEEYTIYHDCGKPYCLTIDSEGKRHFPNHADISANTWLSIGGNEQVSKLMRMDMVIHTMKAEDIDAFILHPEAITLLMAGLAEVHSNAKMFGGIDSTSFKIKWKQIDRRGRAIIENLPNR
jgi:hypothetical protein